MFFRLIYIFVTFLTMTILMFISNKLNSSNSKIKWFIISWLFSCCTPIWLIIVKYSNDILFDAALFDISIFISCLFAGIIFTRNTKRISINEIAGIIIMILGLIIFKINDLGLL